MIVNEHIQMATEEERRQSIATILGSVTISKKSRWYELASIRTLPFSMLFLDLETVSF